MATTQPPTFGQLLKQHRIAADLTQEALAERAGLAARTISDMERGLRSAPYRDTLSRLIQALQLSAAEQAEFEAAARRPSLPSLRRAPGAPIGTEETPPTGAPPPVTTVLVPESGMSIPSESGNLQLSMGAIPPVLQPGAIPTTRPFGPLPGRAGRLIAAAFATARGHGRLASRLASMLLLGILLGGLLLSTGATAQLPWAGGGTVCLATQFLTTSTVGPWDPTWEHAVQLAVQQNQDLGEGYTLKVITYNQVWGGTSSTQGALQQDAENVTKMVQTPCIVGIVGPRSSPVAAAEMPITAQAGLVMISPANTNPRLTMRLYAPLWGLNFDQLHPVGRPTNYFRTVTNDAFQGLELADLASRQPPAGLGYRSAFVVDDHSRFGEVVAGDFTQEFLAMGGKIVGTDGIPFGGAARIAELAARIAAAQPDVVCFAGSNVDGSGGVLKAQLVQAGYSGTFVSGDGVALHPEFIAQVGATGARDVYAIAPGLDFTHAPSGAAASFVRTFHARYPKEELNGYTANAYDAAMILITAIKQLIRAGKAVTRPAVLDQVQNIQYVGVTGQISFDRNGDNTHGIFSVYTVQDGQWVWLQQESV
jgi:branched-chain amino acid transport system substrate-binding protein